MCSSTNGNRLTAFIISSSIQSNPMPAWVVSKYFLPVFIFNYVLCYLSYAVLCCSYRTFQSFKSSTSHLLVSLGRLCIHALLFCLASSRVMFHPTRYISFPCLSKKCQPYSASWLTSHQSIRRSIFCPFRDCTAQWQPFFLFIHYVRHLLSLLYLSFAG